tara:strand:- start:3506 stop:3865 length:360 start_codon:yes stop_codon:yes gene_type:complete
MFGMSFKIIYFYILLILIFSPNFTFGSAFLPNKIKQKIDFLDKKENIVSIFYNDGKITLKGFLGIGNVYIFTIIGNPIFKIENTNLKDLNLRVNLKPKNLYIIRIQKNNSIKTFKILIK